MKRWVIIIIVILYLSSRYYEPVQLRVFRVDLRVHKGSNTENAYIIRELCLWTRYRLEPKVLIQLCCLIVFWKLMCLKNRIEGCCLHITL